MPRYQFAFPVYNATMEDDLSEFQVADVRFVNQSSIPNDFLSSREDLLRLKKNQIFAVVDVCDNKINAKEAAFDRCCFAADIFKICTDLFHSNYFNPKKWQFDIKTDYVTQGSSFFLFKEFGSNNFDSLRLTLHRNRFDTCVNTKLWESRNKWNIKDFESLYQAVYSPNVKSIHKVLKRACHLYSHSFSIDNLYERTVLLCAVLDTLATCERNGKISQLKKHLPRLVLKCEKLNENLKTFIEQVYDIRSAYVHNAEESGLTERDVDYLEKMVYRVILQIIRNTDNYTSIKELCDAIDNNNFVPILDNLPEISVPPCISSRKK